MLITTMPLRTRRRIAAKPQLPFDAWTVAARQAVCISCEWQLDWVCQNPGCKVCPGAQKREGDEPLKRLVADRFFKCPLNKFKP